MKKNMSKKTIGLLVVSLLLVACVGVGSALAYFTTYTEAKGGVELSLGFADTEIDETVEKGMKIVSIKNAEDAAECYVRVKVIVSEQYKDLVKYSEPENAGKWTPGVDGYYYYSDIVAPNGVTSELVVLLSDVSNFATDDFNVIVIQESTPVLYDENGEAYADWNIKADIIEE